LAYELLATGAEPYLGILLEYPADELAQRTGAPVVWDKETGPIDGRRSAGFALSVRATTPGAC